MPPRCLTGSIESQVAREECREPGVEKRGCLCESFGDERYTVPFVLPECLKVTDQLLELELVEKPMVLGHVPLECVG